MFLSGMVPAAIYGILALSIPESPRYLVAKLRDSDAIKVLKMVVGSREAQPKLDEIRKTLGSQTRRSLRDLRGPAGPWAAANRLDRDPAVGVPAVRHQRPDLQGRHRCLRSALHDSHASRTRSEGGMSLMTVADPASRSYSRRAVLMSESSGNLAVDEGND